MINLEQFTQQYEGRTEIHEWVTNTVAAADKKHKVSSVAEVEHIIDWLKSSHAPKRLRRLSYADAVRLSTKWTEQLIKKGNNIVETEKDVKVKHVWDDNSGMRLVKLKSKAAYDREGSLMSHCVSSYHGRKDVKIYSLRDRSNAPHCTIEVVKQDGRINQIKGKGNGSIHPKYIKYILDIIKKLFKLSEIRDSELANLGYVTLTDNTWAVIDKYMTGAKFISLNGKKYLYKYCDLKRKSGE